MKSKIKKLLTIVFLSIIGTATLYFGFQEWRNVRRLTAEGVTTKGQVLEATDRRSGKFRRHTYSLKVQFTPAESSTSITEKVEVSEATFTTATDTGTVTVHYLPSDPTVCSAGEVVDSKYSNLLWGMGSIGAAVFLGVTFRKTEDEPAANDAA